MNPKITKPKTTSPKKLAAINGISPSRLVLPKLDDILDSVSNGASKCGLSVFTFFCQKFGHISQDEWRTRFDDGLVLDEMGVPLSLDTPYQMGMTVYYYRHVVNEIVVPFDYELLFENEHFIIVDKPHFLAVSPAGQYAKETLLTRLKTDFDNDEIAPAHRLDKETAGVMMFTKNSAVRDSYQALFRMACDKNPIKKIYHAIAPAPSGITKNGAAKGVNEFAQDVSLCLERGEPFFVMKVTDNPPNAHTHIRLLDTQGSWAKYELTPTTGKLHQLRATLNHLGLPIKDDPYYPTICHKAKDDFSCPLQLLAKSLSFTDPISGQVYEFVSKKDLFLPSVA